MPPRSVTDQPLSRSGATPRVLRLGRGAPGEAVADNLFQTLHPADPHRLEAARIEGTTTTL